MGKLRSPVSVEVCVDDLASAKAAELSGASSIEICADLPEGGTTPSLGIVELARRRLRVPLHVMIRPRGGDYTYDDDELAVMLRDIRSAQDARATGVVFALLDAAGGVDLERCQVLVEFARPLQSTFSRAFDLTPDPEAAIEAVIAAGFGRLVTSGHSETAWEGRATIERLVQRAGERVQVIASGGLDEVLAPAVVQATRVSAIQVGLGAYHERSSAADAGLDPTPSPPITVTRREVDVAKVRALVDNLARSMARP
ncbi:MAG: copper homeostasis protein CutC [Planctomycetota bacterium]